MAGDYAAKLKEQSAHVSELSIAIHRLNDANAGLAKGFAEFSSSGNKAWTVISRFLSGTGLWRASNFIRALGNSLEVYYLNQTKQMEQQMKMVEGNLALAESYGKIKKEMDKIEGSPYYNMLIKSKKFTKGEALEFAEEFYQSLLDQMDVGVERQGKGLRKLFEPDMRKRIEDEGMLKEMFSPLTTIIDKVEELGPFTKITDTIFGEVENIGGRFKKGGGRHEEGAEGRKGFFKQMGKNWKKIKSSKLLENFGSFIKDTAAILGKAMIWFLLIATGVVILVAIFKKLWPSIRESMEANMHLFKLAFAGLIQILSGIWDIIKAVFRGDIGGVFKAFFQKILPGIINLFGNLLAAVILTVMGIVGRLVMGLLNYIADSWVGKMLNLPRHAGPITRDMGLGPGSIKGMATGGLTTRGGLFRVGENGAELINLPAGARVHSNQQSKAMMGNTFNINVTGRIGASDAEIRDLANKLGNELNKRINRTAASTTGFV